MEYELSYLSAYDMHPFQDKDMKKAPGATVRARAEKNVQLLINKLFASERVEVRLFSKKSKISLSLSYLSQYDSTMYKSSYDCNVKKMKSMCLSKSQNLRSKSRKTLDLRNIDILIH